MPLIVWLCQLFQMTLNTDLVNALLKQLVLPLLRQPNIYLLRLNKSDLNGAQISIWEGGERSFMNGSKFWLLCKKGSKSNCKSRTADLTCGNKKDRKKLKMLEKAMCLPVSSNSLWNSRKKLYCWKWSKNGWHTSIHTSLRVISGSF